MVRVVHVLSRPSLRRTLPGSSRVRRSWRSRSRATCTLRVYAVEAPAVRVFADANGLGDPLEPFRGESRRRHPDVLRRRTESFALPKPQTPPHEARGTSALQDPSALHEHLECFGYPLSPRENELRAHFRSIVLTMVWNLEYASLLRTLPYFRYAFDASLCRCQGAEA